jgi:hypothetical protein
MTALREAHDDSGGPDVAALRLLHRPNFRIPRRAPVDFGKKAGRPQ